MSAASSPARTIQPRGARHRKRSVAGRNRNRLGLLPFFPLASGLLTGKYKRGADVPSDTRFAKAPALKDRYVTARNEDIVEELQAFAQARGHAMLDSPLSWLASRPQVSSVIAGATRVEQVEQNVKAIGWTLSAEELAEVDGSEVRRQRSLHSLSPSFTGEGRGRGFSELRMP